MPRGESSVPPVYECRPPEWLPKAHSSADLGYVGFFPPRPDQDEEILTELKVKNGLTHGPLVPTETYNAQDIANNRLDAEETLSELEELMKLVFTRRAATVPPVPSSSFKLPSRVTLNDARRKQWFADLANPEVPLHKLGKSVPHGAKGHDLLDLLHQHNVAVPRAVWFLRVFGANETTGLRNKPSYNPTQYSVEWANVVTGYMRKQLAEIALPMAPRPGLNIKVTFKGVLADQESREKWLNRFTYCLQLLKAFYSEGLIDNRTFLAWLVQQVGTCNLAQLGFVARLADEYLDGLLNCRALARPFADASLSRISEIASSSGKEHLISSTALLKASVMRTFLANPDAFVCPKLWIQHADLLQEILSDRVDSDAKDDDTGQSEQALIQTFVSHYEDVRKRNEALLFRDLPIRVRGTLTSTLADIKMLNSFSGNSDIEAISFFAEFADDAAAFSRKLDILLTWSVTPLQFGDHRGYVAATLLKTYVDREEERAIRRGRDSPESFIQDQLFDWLDCSEVASENANLPSVALLFGQLVKHGVFSYPHYIQRLIARCEPGLSGNEKTESRHRDFLRWIPLHSTSSSLIAQRKVTLYGVRARETPEDINERNIRKELRALLPGLFSGNALSAEDATIDLRARALTLLSATRFEQIRVFNDWLIPVLKKALTSTAVDASEDECRYLWSYCAITTLLAHCRCYDSMLVLVLFVLRNATTRNLLTAVMQTVRQHIEVWAGLGAMKEIVVALRDAQGAMKLRGMHQRALYNLLFEIDGGHLLEPQSRDQLYSDYAHFTHSLHPENDQSCVVPDALPEILLLTTDPSPDAPTMLANTLWYKYRNAPDWAWKVWDNTIASLRQIPSMIPDTPGRRACALRYATFLTEVDQHISAGSDEHILSWFLGSGRNEIEALSAEAWDVATVVLLHLSIYDALATTTILQGLVYPIWQTAAFVSAPEQGASMEILLEAINELCCHLLLKDICGDGHPPSNHFEVQGLQTRRRDVYREPYFSRMVANIPALVLVEQNLNIPEHIRLASRTFREALCSTTVFRLGVYRDLDAVNTAFEQVLTNRDVPEELHEPLVSALRLMFNEGQQGTLEPMASWQKLSTLLSPWKLAATSIELRFTMKQLGEALRRDVTRDRANVYLDRLTSTVFGQGMNSEEADFMAEIMKSISPEVTTKFVNAGVHRISEIFTESGRDGNLNLMVSKAGDILRLLTNVAEPIRKDAQAKCSLDAWVQGRALQCLHDRLMTLFELMKTDEAQTVGDTVLHDSLQAVVFLARVLQFILGFAGTWSQELTTNAESLCSVLFKLILICGSGRTLDPIVFPLLIDTLYFLLDELPTDPKAVVFDPFRYYPQVELQSLPPDMPDEYRGAIRHLLPYVSQNACVTNLAYHSKDGSGADTFVPVQNRPWEWTEYLGDPPSSDTNAQGEAGPLKNSSSLPLELFSVHPTGEHIVPSGTAGLDALIDNNLRMFQDNLLGESVFRRDWRESRINPERAFSGPPKEPDNPVTHSVPKRMSSSEGRQSSSQSSRVASPAPSVRSRGSVQPAGMITSPAAPSLSRFTGSTAGDPIDVDSLDLPLSADTASESKAHGKRKMQEILEDDEIEIVEGPVASGQAAKRVKGATTTGGRARSKKQ